VQAGAATCRGRSCDCAFCRESASRVVQSTACYTRGPCTIVTFSVGWAVHGATLRLPLLLTTPFPTLLLLLARAAAPPRVLLNRRKGLHVAPVAVSAAAVLVRVAVDGGVPQRRPDEPSLLQEEVCPLVVESLLQLTETVLQR
jgi:hypothetical protein